MFPQRRRLEQARFLPYSKGEMFMAPESTHQVLLVGAYFSSDRMDNLGVRGTGNRGEEFSVSESMFPGPQIFL